MSEEPKYKKAFAAGACDIRYWQDPHMQEELCVMLYEEMCRFLNENKLMPRSRLELTVDWDWVESSPNQAGLVKVTMIQEYEEVNQWLEEL